jgi:hypothetical protein
VISSAEVARRILAAPAPVLLPDTCAILDLMRDPTREHFSADQVEAARRILQMAEARQRRLWLPITAQVLAERRENQANIKQESEVKIRKLEENVQHVQRILGAHGLNTTAIAPSLVASDFPAKSSDLVNKYFAKAEHVSNARDVNRRAIARMAANRAPSKRGQQTKDCIVIESYLSLARLLRQEGLQFQIVFFTTNTQDYSDPQDKGAIHPELVAEFGIVNMRYAVNFQMAEYQLLQP